MIGAEIIWSLLALNQIADAVRNRRRLNALSVLKPSDVAPDPALRFVVAPGVTLDAETRAAAAAHMRMHGIAALDLVPGRLPLATAWSIACHVDAEASRSAGWHQGATAAHALVAPSSLLQSMGMADTPPDLGTFVALAGEVRRRVDGAHDLAVAPRLEAMDSNPFFRAEVLAARLAGGVGPVAFGMPLMWLIVGLGLWLAPWAGLAVVVLLHLQPVLAVLGRRFEVRGWWWQLFLRVPVDVLSWTRLMGSRQIPQAQDKADRDTYAALVADGLAPFFEPEAVACPLCGSEDLNDHLSVPDFYQGKPGRFRLRRCGDCRHIFQDPRLSARGLAYYYRDAYDGRNASGMDVLFGSYTQPYSDRVEMVTRHHVVRRWLDVGCGHGHLCARGQVMLPDARFEGLDFGESVQTALARGWVHAAHRGLFPACAPDMVGAYDVVSMSHYLEHTTNPRAELDAAYTVLAPGGVMMIELPDPDSPWAKWLGRLWMPYFQPQHLHLLSTINLASLLREAGFQPVQWETGVAHQGSDLVLSAYTFLRWLSPPLDAPWRPIARPLARIWAAMVWTPGTLLLLLAALADWMLRPLGKRLHHASAFRVLARRVNRPVGPAEE